MTEPAEKIVSTEPPPIKERNFLDEFAEVALASLTEDSGLATEVAIVARDNLVDRVRQRFGGQSHYVPSGKFSRTERMRREIGRRWDGQNTRELCKEFDISETWLRELYDQSQGKSFTRRGGK